MISSHVIKRAIKEASQSTVRRGKIGAVLFNNSGHIICSAHNSPIYGTPLQHTIHGEIALLNKADKINAEHRYGRDLNVLVIRWKKGLSVLANARPCQNCEHNLRKHDFTVYYSNEDGIIEKL